MSDTTKRPDRQVPSEGEQTVVERRPTTKRPKMYRVLLHNDDYTTMEFVTWILQHVFHKTETQATHLMLTIHHKGLGVAGVYTKDIADTRVAQVTELARDAGMPLLCTSEPEE